MEFFLVTDLQLAELGAAAFFKDLKVKSTVERYDKAYLACRSIEVLPGFIASIKLAAEIRKMNK